MALCPLRSGPNCFKRKRQSASRNDRTVCISVDQDNRNSLTRAISGGTDGVGELVAIRGDPSKDAIPTPVASRNRLRPVALFLNGIVFFSFETCRPFGRSWIAVQRRKYMGWCRTDQSSKYYCVSNKRDERSGVSTSSGDHVRRLLS